MPGDFLTIQEAADEMKISRVKIWRWIRDGKLVAHQSGRDLREKLVRREDVEGLLAPTPIPVEQTKKAAA
ncbi:MAG: helix-turn-helix domain-containing protein [Chloroflexota bacterium]|nr:helix-turn-helix domain-containing protein [Chloroflexota bacterium]